MCSGLPIKLRLSIGLDALLQSHRDKTDSLIRRTLHALLMAIQRKPSDLVNFFDDLEFHLLQNVCDMHYGKLLASLLSFSSFGSVGLYSNTA